MLYRERMKQADREAKKVGIGVAIIVIAWFVLGFGLYNSNITLFSTPLWIIGGCLGTWIVAVVVSVILGCKVIQDCPLEEDDFGQPYDPDPDQPIRVSAVTIDRDLIDEGARRSITYKEPNKAGEVSGSTSRREKEDEHRR